MTTKQSIHEEFNKKFMAYEASKLVPMSITTINADIKSFYDTKIRQVLEEIVPKEITYEEAIKISAQILTNMNGGIKCGYNQATAEMKQKIKELGF